MDGEDNFEDYELFDYRLCTCTCDFCTNRAPHPIFNCVYGCTRQSKVSPYEEHSAYSTSARLNASWDLTPSACVAALSVVFVIHEERDRNRAEAHQEGVHD